MPQEPGRAPLFSCGVLNPARAGVASRPHEGAAQHRRPPTETDIQTSRQANRVSNPVGARHRTRWTRPSPRLHRDTLGTRARWCSEDPGRSGAKVASPYRPAPGPASAQEHRCNGSARVHSQAGVDSLVSRLPARHPVRALRHPGSGRRRQAPGAQPHAREIRAVAQVATAAARRVADGHGTARPRCHQRAEQDRRRSRPGVRTPPGGGLRAQSRGHRLRARPAACSAPSTGDSRTVVLCPAEGEGDPHGGSAPFGSCGTQASHRSVPAGRSEAALGEAGGREKFSLLLTTRFGNAVAVNTWNTCTWKPALAKAGTSRLRSLSVTMLTSCRRLEARDAAPSTVCLGSAGDQLASRNSPDSPQRYWPGFPVSSLQRSLSWIARLKRWVA